MTAYSPLGSPDRPPGLRGEGDPVLLEDPVIRAIADRRGLTPAQVAIAWALARGTAVIPKSTHPERLKQNLDAAAGILTEEDLRDVAGLDRGRRYFDSAFWALEGSPYTVKNLWDEEEDQ